MPSIGRCDSSSEINPVLDIWTARGNPLGSVDVAELSFRILDISTPAKRVSPVQIYPTAVGTFEAIDPSQAPPNGVRLSLGHYYAPWTVPADEPIGDHRIEWQFRLTPIDVVEQMREEFFVSEAANPFTAAYTSEGMIRGEGFTDLVAFPSSRINLLIPLAASYIHKMTGRWFYPRKFDETFPMKLDGKGGRIQHLEIPIITVSKVSIENQGFLDPDLSEIDSGYYRVYNRHLSGMDQPDDRENPRISIIETRGGFGEVIRSGLYSTPLSFPVGRQNIWLEGYFGYTDGDGSIYGKTPDLIRHACTLLVCRDLHLLNSNCNRLNARNKFRIIMDKEGSTQVRLQELWLKGAFTGDPEIDNILMAYKRPPRMAVA